MSTAAVENNSKRFGLTGVNPMIRKAMRASEQEAVSANTASYAGVIRKSGFFLMVTMIGVLLYFFMERFFAIQAGGFEINEILQEGVLALQTTNMGLACVGGAAVIGLISVILTFFVPKLIPVAGTAYVLTEGYVLAAMNNMLVPGYRWIGIAALVLTVCLVGVLLVLYRRGAVGFSAKLRRVVFTAFFAMVAGGLLLFICQFIPGLNVIANAWSMILSNPIISAGLSIFYIMTACVFLLADFDAARALTESGADCKYEWHCAFGIACSVLYLYLKIFRLLVQIVAKSKK